MQKIEIRTRDGICPSYVYPAKHGWVMRDTAVYDEAACQRHWRTLTQLFGDVLKCDAAG
jgi:dienelactone hydrolase